MSLKIRLKKGTSSKIQFICLKFRFTVPPVLRSQKKHLEGNNSCTHHTPTTAKGVHAHDLWAPPTAGKPLIPRLLLESRGHRQPVDISGFWVSRSCIPGQGLCDVLSVSWKSHWNPLTWDAAPKNPFSSCGCGHLQHRFSHTGDPTGFISPNLTRISVKQTGLPCCFHDKSPILSQGSGKWPLP